MLGDAPAQTDTDATIIGRSTPAGTYKWMLVPGTIVQETGRSGDNIRVRLDSQLEVWVDSTSVRSLAGGLSVAASHGGRDVRSCRPPSGSTS